MNDNVMEVRTIPQLLRAIRSPRREIRVTGKLPGRLCRRIGAVRAAVWVGTVWHAAVTIGSTVAVICPSGAGLPSAAVLPQELLTVAAIPAVRGLFAASVGLAKLAGSVILLRGLRGCRVERCGDVVLLHRPLPRCARAA